MNLPQCEGIYTYVNRLSVVLKGISVGRNVRHAILEALRLFVAQAVDGRFD